MEHSVARFMQDAILIQTLHALVSTVSSPHLPLQIKSHGQMIIASVLSSDHGLIVLAITPRVYYYNNNQASHH